MPIILSLLWGALSKFIGAAFTFFTTKPGVYVGVALLVIAAFWYTDHRAYNRGVAVTIAKQHEQDLKDIAEAYKSGLQRQASLDKDMASLAFTAGEARGKTEAVTVTIIKKVPTYVTAETDHSFPVPCGLVRLHDAGALGTSPESISLPAGLTDDKACPVEASVLATVIVENYGLYHTAEVQIAGLQDLARTLKATIENNTANSP
jgi:hypothetical protein